MALLPDIYDLMLQHIQLVNSVLHGKYLGMNADGVDFLSEKKNKKKQSSVVRVDGTVTRFIYRSHAKDTSNPVSSFGLELN